MGARELSQGLEFRWMGQQEGGGKGGPSRWKELPVFPQLEFQVGSAGSFQPDPDWEFPAFPFQSLFERQGMAAHSGVLAGTEKPHVSLRKGIPRTKSVGEEKPRENPLGMRREGPCGMRSGRERLGPSWVVAPALGVWDIPWNSGLEQCLVLFGAKGGAGKFQERISGENSRNSRISSAKGREALPPPVLALGIPGGNGTSGAGNAGVGA